MARQSGSLPAISLVQGFTSTEGLQAPRQQPLVKQGSSRNSSLSARDTSRLRTAARSGRGRAAAFHFPGSLEPASTMLAAGAGSAHFPRADSHHSDISLSPPFLPACLPQRGAAASCAPMEIQPTPSPLLQRFKLSSQTLTMAAWR